MFRLLGSSTAHRLGYIRPIGFNGKRHLRVRVEASRQRNILPFPSTVALRCVSVKKTQNLSEAGLYTVYFLSGFPVFGMEHKQIFMNSAYVQLSEECSLFWVMPMLFIISH
jgi:hypothetical protein